MALLGAVAGIIAVRGGFVADDEASTPGERSLLWSVVERRVLSSTLVTRGFVHPEVATGVVGPLPLGGVEAVVTGVSVGVGDVVESVVPVVEVSGRPVFVMAGSSPMFRQLGPGMTGDDVAQLQDGLVASGCDAGASGVFDEATKRCVVEMYEQFGYSPVRASEGEEAALAAARETVAAAADEVADAEAALELAEAGPTDLQLLEARQAVTTAGNELVAARSTATRELVQAVQAHDLALRNLNAELVGLNPNSPHDSDSGDRGGGGGGGGGFDPGVMPGDGALEMVVTVGRIVDDNGDGVGVGDVLPVSVTVSNVGEVDFEMLEVVVGRVGVVTCPAGPLRVGELRVCAPVAVVLTADDLGRTIAITAQASATPPVTAEFAAPTVVAVESTVSVPGRPRVRLDKRVVEFVDVDGAGVGPGDEVVYSFAVSNIGNVPLSPVEVFDPMLVGVPHLVDDGVVLLDGFVPCGDPVVALAVGETRWCDEVRYPVRADQLASLIENTATVVARPPEGDPVEAVGWAAIWIPPACTTGQAPAPTTLPIAPTTAPPSESSTTVVGSTDPPSTVVPEPTPTAAPPVTVPAEASTTASLPISEPDEPVATPAGLRLGRRPAGVVLPTCPEPPSDTTTTTTSTTTTLPPLNAPVPPGSVWLPDVTEDAPPLEQLGGDVVVGGSGGGGGSGGSSGGGRVPGVGVTGRVAATEALRSAERGLATARSSAERKVAEADAAVERARAELAALEQGTQVTGLQRTLDRAMQRLGRAEAELGAVQAAAGPVVRLGEVVFVPSLPARVDTVSAVVGEPANGGQTAAGSGGGVGGFGGVAPMGPSPLLVLSSAGLVVTAEVPAADVGALAVGDRAVLLDELTGATAEAAVVRVGVPRPLPATGGLAAEVVLSGESIPPEWSGRNVRVTFTATVSDQAVLVVPLAAVRLGGDGVERVEVIGADGVARQVEVVAGRTANGAVEVTPITAAALGEGDRVVTGLVPVEAVAEQSLSPMSGVGS